MQIPTPISGDLSLYVHLPFCQKKCDYCHFFVLPNKQSFKDELFDALIAEIQLYQEQFKNSKILSLYFGGGTPALVGPNYIHKLLQSFQRFVSLDQAEITLELNPENHDFEQLKDFKQAGINRLSIGVQSFDPLLLKTLGREHSALEAQHAVLNAHRAGIEHLSIDLMYELPTQTLEQWSQTLQTANTLPIDHISLYNLSIEPYTVFYKYRDQIRKKMPNQKLALQMYEKSQSFLKDQGWEPYEISALAKDGAYSRHNVGYWMQRNHLGFGPSAFSLMNSNRWQNVKNLKAYAKQVQQGIKPHDFSEQLSPEAFLRESLCLQLRLYQGVKTNTFQNRFGVFADDLKETLEHLQQQGLLLMKKDHLALTALGRLHHDAIASEIVLA